MLIQRLNIKCAERSTQINYYNLRMDNALLPKGINILQAVADYSLKITFPSLFQEHC